MKPIASPSPSILSDFISSQRHDFPSCLSQALMNIGGGGEGKGGGGGDWLLVERNEAAIAADIDVWSID